MNNHFAIPVKNLKESKKFYEKLGFKAILSWKEKPALKAALLQDKSGCKIELIYHSTNKELKFSKIAQVQHLGIAVTKLENKIEELSKKGIKIVVPITKGTTVKQFAFVRDPNGFSIEFVEY